MPIVTPRKPVLEVVPQAPPKPTITPDEVRAMLAERDAAWQAKFDALSATFAAAIANMKPAKKVAYVVEHKYGDYNLITKSIITPKE